MYTSVKAMDMTTDVDGIWESLGKWGRYQKFQIAIQLLDIIPCALHLLSVVFIGYKPPYECAEAELEDFYLYSTSSPIGDNGSLYITYESCKMNLYKNTTNSSIHIQSQSCINGYTYGVPKDRTFVTQLDLVCDKSGLSELSQTLIMVGQAFGAAIFTTLADRYGRKPIHVFCHVALFGITLGLSFIQNYIVFAVLRVFVGVFQQGLGLTCAILLIELLPMQSRYITEVMGLTIWTTGVNIIAVFGYFMKDLPWRYMQLALALVSSYSLIEYWLVDESLRWLTANGKQKEAERTIRKAARWNGVRYEDVMKSVNEKLKMKEILIDVKSRKINKLSNNEPDIIAENKDVSFIHEQKNDLSSTSIDNIKTGNGSVHKVEHYSFFTILKKKRLLFNSMIMWYAWTVNSLTYYGIMLISSKLSGNRFLNYVLATLVEYPAALGELLLINRIGRKRTCILFHSIAGLSLIIATLLATVGADSVASATASTAFTLIGKFAITGSFSTIFLYTPELYPTNLRNAGIGFSSAAARAGGMLAPFAGTLAEQVSWAPGAIFGVMCLIVTVLATFLPETKGHELPQTVDELNEWYKTHSKRSPTKKKVKSDMNTD